MYLTCPSCQTVYTVRAAMLRDGQGEVRCGACRTLFNALDYLSDELPDGASARPAGDPPAPQEAQEVPIVERAAAVMSDGPASTASEEVQARPESAEPSTPPAYSPAPRARTHPVHDDGVPAVLADDWRGLQHDRDAPRRNVGFGVLAVLLLLALAGQYLWFEPKDLVARFPQTAAAVDRFCRFTGCIVPERRDPSQIRMLGRDVRAHPRYEGALLVSATFSNNAPWPQPYPRLRFRLYNVNGQTIASRVFEPVEYLPGSLPPDAMMSPARPLQVALEMLAPEEAAVSFEFSFI